MPLSDVEATLPRGDYQVTRSGSCAVAEAQPAMRAKAISAVLRFMDQPGEGCGLAARGAEKDFGSNVYQRGPAEFMRSA